MTTKTTPFAALILAIWMAIVMVAAALTVFTSRDSVSLQYDVMTEAASLARQSMQAIKQYKLDNGIALSEYDKLNTGMIGSKEITSITTTSGVLEAKRTSCDPNWAAVIVGMFIRAGLRPGDQAAMVFSGSFPAMNICAMAAAQAYEIDVCIMASVGASNYGANNPDFTFFDMAEYLYAQGILTKRINYVSLGGDMDIGRDFADEAEKNAIIARINASDSVFIHEGDYEKNIELRIKYLKQDVPHMGFLLNVGGSMVGLGVGINAFIGSGYYSASRYSSGNLSQKKPDYGLIQCCIQNGIPAASMLNFKGLAEIYGIAYDPDVLPVIGAESGCNVYYSRAYDIVVPIIALVISAGVLIFYYIHRTRNGVEGRKDERNRILCRR